MSQKQLAFPQTPLQALRPASVIQKTFTGMNVDFPASEIGATELVELINLISYGRYVESRTGSKRITETTIPKLEVGGTELSITASKTGYDVTLVDPGLLTNFIAGDYFIWSDGLLDQVTAITASGFTSLMSETRASDLGCGLIRQPMGAFYHEKSKQVFVQLGIDLYIINNQFEVYTKIPYTGSSSYKLSRSPSLFRGCDVDVIVFNEGGVFRIVYENPITHYFKINADNPSYLLDEVAKAANKTIGRQVIYSYSRIIGGNFNNGRTGINNVLLQETASCSPDATTRRDSAKIFQTLPVGIGSELSYSITSYDDSSLHVNTTISDWIARAAGSGIKVALNGVSKNIRPDFTGVETMFDVSDRFQAALQIEYPDITSVYKISDSGNPILTFYAGEDNLWTEPDAVVYPGEYIIPPDAGENLTGLGGLPLQYLHMNYFDDGVDPVATQAKAPMFIDGARVGADSSHLTHYSLYATVNIGDVGVANGNKTEKLIWSRDIPIIRSFKGHAIEPDGIISIESSQGLFYQTDEHNKILMFNGAVLQSGVLADVFYDPLYAETSERTKITVSPSGDTIIGPGAIGASKVGLATQSGYTVTINTTTTGTVNTIATGSAYLFADTDVGQTLFLADGTTRTIKKYIDTKNVEVVESGNFTNLSCAWIYSNIEDRKITDSTTDEVLLQRGDDDDFLLQTRYYEPIPSSNIGEMTSNFLFIADDNTTQLIYNSVPFGKKHRLGYYHPGEQVDDISSDPIKYIKRYADRIVVFCRKSTWVTNTTTITSLDEPDIGEKVFILPHLSLLANIGFTHIGSMQDIGIGQSIMITSEPAVRIFNGQQYSEINYANDQIMFYIQRLCQTIYSSYDGVGGYRLYGSLQVTSTIANRINPETGFCLRYAVMPSQGSGWSIFNGESMVMPMPFTYGIGFQNENDYNVQIMLDERSGRWHIISTYDGPEGSNLTTKWTDKDTAEIECSITLREDKAEPESQQLEFLTSHVYLRPSYGSEDEDGNPVFRDGFTVTARVYNDGLIAYTAQANNITVPGDVSFDRKSQGPRIQIQFLFSTGQFQIVSIERVYATRDRAGNQSLASRNTSEMDYQKNYSDQILWLTRGKKRTLNRSVGTVATGTPLSTTGPDGQANSAMLFDGAETSVSLPIYSDLAGNMSIQFGFKLPVV